MIRYVTQAAGARRLGLEHAHTLTVRFITEKPCPGLIDRMAATDFLPMPPKMLKEQGVQALIARPTGTGPFKFVQWVRDERLVPERNPDYWQGAPDVTRVTFRFIPEFSAL